MPQFSDTAVQYGAQAAVVKVVAQAKLPTSTWIAGITYVIGNNASTVRPYFGDKGPAVRAYVPMQAARVVGTVDPTTYPDADIVDGDIWHDTTVPTFPIDKFYNAAGSAWVRKAIVFTGATDPVTTYGAANVQAGDHWADTTTSATPTLKIRVGSAWNTIA